MFRRFVFRFVFCWFLIGGLAHFIITDAVMSIVPPWLPWPRALVLVSGGFELLGAAGMLRLPMRRAAGWGLMALTVAVTPANVYMWRHAADFAPIPYWALTLRLPFQVILLFGIWWSTRPARHPPLNTLAADESRNRPD